MRSTGWGRTAPLMNSLGDALKAADQHAKSGSRGVRTCSACWRKSQSRSAVYASCLPWPEQVVLDGERETLGFVL